MAAQYWVGDFFVDLSRNQITQKTESKTIPPKALAVLTHLAKNANKVVSHDELLEEVWPDTVVTPNTLQRSIAQLRKVLGEDSQFQSYIKTHAKQGYSLEVEVRWQGLTDTELLIEQASTANNLQENNNSQANPDNNHLDTSNLDSAEFKSTTNNSTISKPASSSLKLFSAIAGLTILVFFAVKALSPVQPLKLSFGELRSLTTTDNKEHSGIYSPDGEYIVFSRYSLDVCSISNIWAKNIKTYQETQLTKNWGRYGSHSFSKDGKKLIFIESETCNKPITQNDCYKLSTLDFEKALESPQSPDVLMECKNSRISSAKWINNNNVLLFQDFSNGKKLASYSIAENKSTVIYEIEQGNLIDYDYSVKDDLIALTSVHGDGQNYIEIIQSDGQLISSHPIDYPPEIPNLRLIYPNFTPSDGQLIFSTGRQLFTLSYEGKITNISLPIDESMGSPIFHPNGKRMLMTKGHYDSDMAKISLAQLKQSEITNSHSEQPQLTPVIFERSTLGEDGPVFQPNGELIAFRSSRSGDNQIWLNNGSGSRQLTQFPTDSWINGLNWAADGESLLVNINQALIQVDLDSNQTSYPLEYPVVQLFQWDSNNNSALVLVRIKGIEKFAELNLNNAEFRVITDKAVNWALKSEDGRLIYLDHMNRFWQPGAAEHQLIDALDNQAATKQRFLIKDNIIYGINEGFQLWSYDLNLDTFELLGEMPKNIDDLNDINQTNILISVRISAKKEIAELLLAD
jgi:DNA-binding winged helix-turn-helix (wHTH) protein/Tol biopolymer transport system component